MNTLNSLTFNNNGGVNTPTVATGGVLVLNATNAITSTNDNYATTPTLSGTLELNGTNRIVATSGMSPVDLSITAFIQNSTGTAGLIKSGSGSLVLASAASTFNGGLLLSQGTLIVGANSAPATIGAVVTAGPLGTGTFTIADGATVQSGAAAQAIANPVTVNGSFTFGGVAATNNLSLIHI